MALIEWKPVEGSYGSFADAGSNALKAGALGAANILSAFQTGADLARRIDTNNLMKELALAYDPKNLQSYNDALKLGAATYNNVDPETWQLLNGTYRTQQNAQLNAENLLLNQMAVSEKQNRANLAAANGNIPEARLANEALMSSMGIDGNPVRSDAVTPVNVDALLTSATNRAATAAGTALNRAQLNDMQMKRASSDFITAGANWMLPHMSATTLNTPEGRQALFDLAETYVKQAGPQDYITPDTTMQIVQLALQRYGSLNSLGIDPGLSMTPTNTASYRVYDPVTGEYTDYSFNVDPTQGRLYQQVLQNQRLSEEQRAARQAQQEEFNKALQVQEGAQIQRQANFRTLEREVRNNGDLAFNDQRNRILYSTLTPKEKELIDLTRQEKQLEAQEALQEQLDKEEAQKPTSRKNILSAFAAMGSTGPMATARNMLTAEAINAPSVNISQRLQEIRKRKDELRKQQEQAAQVNNLALQAEELNRVVQSGEFDRQARNKVNNAVRQVNSMFTDYRGDIVESVGNEIDPDRNKVGVQNISTDLIEATSLRNGIPTAYFGTLETYKDPTGKVITKTPESMSGEEVVKEIDNRFSDYGGGSNFGGIEKNVVKGDFYKLYNYFLGAFANQTSVSAEGYAQIQQAAKVLAMDAIIAGIERNSGLNGMLLDTYDYHSSEAFKAAGIMMDKLTGKDSLYNQQVASLRNLNDVNNYLTTTVGNFNQENEVIDTIQKSQQTRGARTTDVVALYNAVKNSRTNANMVTNELNRFLYPNQSK